jgi:hypothetical protein
MDPIIRRGKQWQTIPKNLPRMQRSRAIPVAWPGCGFYQNWPKGWIPIIIIIIIIIISCIDVHVIYFIPETASRFFV